MNNFKINIKQGGEFVPLGATAVFPFSFGELLDERLDEAYITFYGSRVKTYRPTTEFKVSVADAFETTDFYFILAGDNSVEYPTGSGKYKHSCYLIERTKWLEGDVCSSLTFRNPLGNDYLMNASPAINIGGPSFDVPLVNTPQALGITISLPSVNEVGETIIQGTLDRDLVSGANRGAILSTLTGEDDTSIKITNEKGYYETYSDLSELPSIEITEKTTIVYTINIKYYFATTELRDVHYVLKYEIVGINNKFPLRRYTITDVVNRCLELAVPLFKGQAPKYVFDGVTYSDGEIVPYSTESKYRPGSMADIFDKVYAPEFNLTQDTLREQLKVIGGYIHGEPWIDENNVVYYQIFNDATRSGVDGLPYIGDTSTWHINEYNTEIRTNAQNLVSSLGYAKGVIVDPGNSLYRSLRNETLYVRINEDNGIAQTQMPIYDIESVYCGIINQAWLDGSESYPWWLAPRNVTPYVVEATQYASNLSAVSSAYPYSRSYAIYYTFGQSGIGGLFFKVPDAASGTVFARAAITNILATVASDYDASAIDTMVAENPEHLVFMITYKPISSHYVSHGKQMYEEGIAPFTKVYNQGENMIESQFFGENVKGIAARLGNIDRERTFLLRRMKDIPRTGQSLDGAVISAVSTEVMPMYIKCTVGLTPGYNRISEYVGVNSQKRMYEISERQTVSRSLLLKETLVIGKLPENYDPSGKIFYRAMPTIRASLAGGGSVDGLSMLPVSVAYMHGRKKGGTAADAVVNDAVILPVVSRALGNSIVMSFATKDNYSAGDKAQYISNGDVSGRFQNDVRYTDYYGRMFWNQIILSPMWNENTDADQSVVANNAFNTPQNVNAELYNKILNNRYVGIGIDGNSTDAPLHRIRKDNAEALQYNIELEFKTSNEDIVIGSAMASYCRMVSGINDGYVTNPTRLVLLSEPNSIGKFTKAYTPNGTDYVIPVGLAGATYSYSLTDVSTNSFMLNPIDLSTVSAIAGRTFYGWAIITPEKMSEYEVEDDDGNVITVTDVEGNEVVLSSLAPFTSGDTIMNDLYFYLA